jgi:hypothetical protein
MSSYGPPGRPCPGQPQDPYDQPSDSTRLLVAIVVVLAVLVVSGAAAAFYLTRNDNEPIASPSTPAAAPAGGQQAGGAQGGGEQTGTEPTTPAEQSGTPAPEASAEARFAVKGQCLVNDGTDDKPSMRIVPCAPNTYEVLARFDGTTDYKSKCGKVKDYQFHFFYDSELNALDFVLCLKKR